MVAGVRVAEIWRFPVKSLGGEMLQSAQVDELGISGDRAWGLYDPAADKVLTARREPRLLFLSAQVIDGVPVIKGADGEVLPDDDALSDWLGQRVVLRAAGAGEVRFEAPLDEDAESNWVAWDSTHGTFHDGRSKLSIVSRGSIGAWDRRRFRLNVVVDEGDERDLAGEVRVGTVHLMIRQPIDRCIMVTRAQPGIERDLEVLKQIRRERDNELGMGAVVAAAGEMAVGDELVSR